jgi:hypothetical protein
LEHQINGQPYDFHSYRMISASSMEKKKNPTTLAAMPIQAATCLGLDI